MWPCHALLDGPKSLRYSFEFSLDHCLLIAKGTMPKYPTVFIQHFFNDNWAWPNIAENNSEKFIDHRQLDAKRILKKYVTLIFATPSG